MCGIETAPKKGISLAWANNSTENVEADYVATVTKMYTQGL